MKKVNINDLSPLTWASPKGKFAAEGKQVSEALGRDPTSTDLRWRHPFDIEICRIAAGKPAYPYHSHGSQWEFYHILSGSGSVRHAEGTTKIEAGDAFIFKPGDAHQLISAADAELVVLVVADNPINESGYYPDSKKWIVRVPERRLLRSESLDYFDGEE